MDGQPTCFCIRGNSGCGIPQGCPLGPFWANLAAAAWELQCRRAAPGVKLWSYLDDRFLMATNGKDMDKAIKATAELDAALGVELNQSKCHRSFAGKHMPSLRGCPRTRQFPLATASHVYLGIDLNIHGAISKPRADSRKHSFMERCSFIQKLPACTRGPCTADAVASLWTAAGTSFTKAQAKSMVSAAAAALRGRKSKGQAMFRSREVEHAFAFGPHRTHALYASWYTLCRGLALQCNNRYSPSKALWEQMWQHRAHARNGPLAQAHALEKTTLVKFTAPFVVECGNKRVDMATICVSQKEWQKKWHQLRDVLRVGLWRAEATRRPKDFAGAENGIKNHDECYPLWKSWGGPSLLAAGQWTQGRLFKANLTNCPLCPRCGAEFETLQHRLWECPAGLEDRRQLLEICPWVSSQMPNCLRRCGLMPADWQHDTETILSYMHNQTIFATRRCAEAKALDKWLADDSEQPTGGPPPPPAGC